MNTNFKIIGKWNKNGNTKVGSIWTWSTLMSDEAFYIDKLGTSVVGTCGKHCNGCKNDCYVKKSYRYPSVKLGHARNTLALRENPHVVADELTKQIKRAKNQPLGCRFNQSGEIENLEQLLAFCKVAESCKDKFFYIYTKAYEIVIPALLLGIVPKNLIVLISIWHEYGISEYNQVKHLPNVKAFVYDDMTFDYKSHGIEIQTYCKAYDMDGKMDHSITCEKCKKCFYKFDGWKIIGCYAH